MTRAGSKRHNEGQMRQKSYICPTIRKIRYYPMKKILILFYIAALFLAACKDNSYKTGKSGLRYRIISTGKGELVKPGQFLKMQLRQEYGDTILNDTKRTGAAFQQLDTAVMSAASFDIFRRVRAGDSLIFRLPADSAFGLKKPSFYKKKVKELVTYIKIESLTDSVEGQRGGL